MLNVFTAGVSIKSASVPPRVCLYARDLGRLHLENCGLGLRVLDVGIQGLGSRV